MAVLVFLGLIALLRRPCDWKGIVSQNWALFLFYAYLALSITWETSVDSPLIKIFRPIGDLVMALIVTTELNPREAILTMFRRTAILLIPLSLVLIRYYPSLGRGQDKHWGPDYWIGVTTHKNPLGQLCIVAILGFLWSLPELKRRGLAWTQCSIAWFYLAVSGYIMFCGESNSRSSTSIFCLGVAMGLYAIFGRMRDRTEKIIHTIMAGTIALGIVALTLDFFGTSLQTVLAESLGKDPTLTGRTWLWKDVVRIGMENPILGTGYGGFWVPSIYSKLSPEVDNGPAEAHNGYLETFANLGLVGVFLLALFILQSLGNATKMIQADFEYGRLRLSLFFMILVMNYSEATFPRGTHLWWYGFLIVAIYARPWVIEPQAWPDAEAEAIEEERAVPEEMPA